MQRKVSLGLHGNMAGVASVRPTHFVINEELDRQVLKATEKSDEEALAKIPENIFKVGTAEIKNRRPVIAA